MQPEVIKNKGQARLFENPILEALSKTRPWVIYSIYIPVCLYMLFYSYQTLGFSAGRIATVFFGAVLFWTFFEYLAHRYLFHYEPSSELGRRIVYIFHGNHHEYPRDKMRLFMPPVPSVLFASVIFVIIWSLFKLITGSGDYTFMFFPGFMIGYLAYVSMHYAIHAYAPPKFMKALWRNHHLHHYKYPEKGFGVSSTLWDVIFGSVPEKK
ncbi:fatty acid hydroxylase [Pseudoxanthomonas sp. SGD-10]|nr:fatty acid hydroxylase [Pseudoxanthomonas sp. SGD-10]